MQLVKIKKILDKLSDVFYYLSKFGMFYLFVDRVLAKDLKLAFASILCLICLDKIYSKDNQEDNKDGIVMSIEVKKNEDDRIDLDKLEINALKSQLAGANALIKAQELLNKSSEVVTKDLKDRIRELEGLIDEKQ